MGWMEFVMSEDQKYNLMLALIAKGVLNPIELQEVFAKLEAILNPEKFREHQVCCNCKNQNVNVRLEGILHGKTFLDRLANFVYLLEDEMREQAQKEKH